MLQPRLTDLFKPIVVSGAAAHPIKILRDDRMVGLRQCKPIDWQRAVVTRSRSDAQPDGVIEITELFYFFHNSNDDIGSRLCTNCRHDH